MDNVKISGVIKKAFCLTFEHGGMGGYMLDFSDQYKKIKVPTQFPRKTRQISATADLKASEWRTIAIVAFAALNDVFDVEEDDHSAKAKKISDLRFFWLLTVKF